MNKKDMFFVCVYISIYILCVYIYIVNVYIIIIKKLKNFHIKISFFVQD